MSTRNIEQKYVPISSLPSIEEADLEHDTLTWDFSFPPSVDTERLYVNARGLGRVQRMAALQASLVFEYQGPRTTYTPTVVGMNLDGTAVAGRIGKTQRAETNQQRLIDKSVPAKLKTDYFQSISVHELNRAELADRVVERRQNTSRKAPAEKAWAEVVDAALGASLRGAAKQNLVKRAPRPTKALSGVIVAANGAEFIGGALEGNYTMTSSAVITLSLVWGLTVGMSAASNKLKFGKSLLRERKWSAMPYGDWQPDRYLAVAALTHTTELITARP